MHSTAQGHNIHALGRKMNKGIEILLARMESNPDEFMGVNNKWSNLIESHEDYMTDEDRKALFAKLHELRMDRFTEHVMKELFKDKETEQEATAAAKLHIQQQLQARQQQAQLAQQNALAQQQMYNAAQAGSLTGLTNIALGSCTVPSASPYAIQDSNQTSSTLQLGKQTLTERTLTLSFQNNLCFEWLRP